MTAERLERYRYDTESGRLRQRIPDRAYDYDAGGRTTEDGRLRYRYGAQGRLVEITRAATGQRRAAYRYNALGERVKKLGTSVTYYHYDLEGRLLAETDASGQTRAEYLYLGNESLALSRSGQLYYYHNDHLGTPQKLTDGAGQVVWSARYQAFGEASIRVGYVTQNLRFPGQYYDEESGLHYNYHQYYDPGTGRYITSDPIGLQGGLNTYAYAFQNPNKYIDRLGLAGVIPVPGVFPPPAGTILSDAQRQWNENIADSIQDILNRAGDIIPFPESGRDGPSVGDDSSDSSCPIPPSSGDNGNGECTFTGLAGVTPARNHNIILECQYRCPRMGLRIRRTRDSRRTENPAFLCPGTIPERDFF